MLENFAAWVLIAIGILVTAGLIGLRLWAEARRRRSKLRRTVRQRIDSLFEEVVAELEQSFEQHESEIAAVLEKEGYEEIGDHAATIAANAYRGFIDAYLEGKIQPEDRRLALECQVIVQTRDYEPSKPPQQHRTFWIVLDFRFMPWRRR